MQAKVMPTLLANWAMWPLAHYINFKYVPTDGRILYNNCIAVAWCAILCSTICQSLTFQLKC